MNMRYFSILHQKTFKTFLIAWEAVQENIVDYLMKHSYAKHHKHVSPIYLHTNKTLRLVPLILLKPYLQGCLDPEYSKIEEFLKTFIISQIAHPMINIAGHGSRTGKPMKDTEHKYVA